MTLFVQDSERSELAELGLSRAVDLLEQGNAAGALQEIVSIQSLSDDTRNSHHGAVCNALRGRVLNELRRWPEALGPLTEAASTLDSSQQPVWAAQCCYDIGEALFNLGEFADAFQQYERSVQLLLSYPLPTSLALAECQHGAGHALTRLQRRKEALARYAVAARLYRLEAVEKKDAGECCNHAGTESANLNRNLQALRWYERARRIFAQLEETGLEAGCESNIGMVHRTLGNHQTAIMWFDQAKDGYKRAGLTDRVARCDYRAGVAMNGAGLYAQAIRRVQLARVYFEANGPVLSLAECDYEIARGSYELHACAEALQYFLHAIAAVTDRNAPEGKIGFGWDEALLAADSYFGAGKCCIDLKEYPNALGYFRFAHDIYRERSGEGRLTAECGMGMSQALYQMLQYSQALDHVERVRPVFASLRDQRQVAECDHGAGLSLYQLSEYGKAAARFDAATAGFSQVDREDLAAESAALAERMYNVLAKEDPLRAADYVTTAILRGREIRALRVRWARRTGTLPPPLSSARQQLARRLAWRRAEEGVQGRAAWRAPTEDAYAFVQVSKGAAFADLFTGAVGIDLRGYLRPAEREGLERLREQWARQWMSVRTVNAKRAEVEHGTRPDERTLAELIEAERAEEEKLLAIEGAQDALWAGAAAREPRIGQLAGQALDQVVHQLVDAHRR